jgi:signal peptidase I
MNIAIWEISSVGEGKTWKREIIGDIAVIAIILIFFVGSNIGLQLYLGTSTPLYAVESGSMEPTLYRGDLVIVRAVDPETLEVGDIIIFEVPSYDVPIVHRIIEIEQDNGELNFTTKGDNNPIADNWSISASNIIAKVIGTVRYLGFIALFVFIPGAIYTIILLIVMFLLLSFLCDIPKSQKTELNAEKQEKVNHNPERF